MSITLGNTSVSSSGDSITVDDNTKVDGYVKIGDAAESASVAGAGALKYSSRLLLSNGTDWLPIYIERDGSVSKPIYFLSDVADVYSSDQTLYVNPGGLGDTVQYTVDFTTPSSPRYKATNTGTGFCTDTNGNTGGSACSQGTGAAYDMWSAASYCMKAGARLCSKAGLDDAGGTGCSHDNRGIWTTDTDGNGNHWVGEGQTGVNTGAYFAPDYTGSFSIFTINEIGIRCCGTGGTDGQYWTI